MNFPNGPVPEDTKWAFSTRRVNRDDVCAMDTDFAAAAAGDLILARVEKINQHRRVQLTAGRPSELFPGDLIVAACGARYAPDQFEGIAEIDPNGVDLLAGGGCIGRMRLRDERKRVATRLIPVGRLLDAEGAAVNLRNYALKPAQTDSDHPPVIAVAGTSMNSGKTLATARLALGLRLAGWRVGAVKATGTGAFGDYNEYTDTGAHYVADFTDAGMVTTYLESLERIKAGIRDLLADAAQQGCEIVVMEIADGLLQKETAGLLADAWFQARISGLIFACGDAVAAAGGVAILAEKGLKPDAITGVVSCSPMAAQEAFAATGIRVMRKDELADPAEATVLATRAGAHK